MAFTDDEKVRIRHHLGYLNVAQGSTFVLGVPAALEPQFIIEIAMNKVLPAAEGLVRRLLANCDAAEEQIAENTQNVAATQVDEIALNDKEFEQIVKRLNYWRGGLANALAIYQNPFDKRGATSAINRRVV